MKILFIITRSDLGGAQSVVLNLCNSLLFDGHEVLLAASSSGPLWNLVDKKVIKIEISSLQRKLSFIKDLRTLFEIKRIYKKFKPDIIHLHSSKAGFLGRLALLKYKDKIVYTVHGFDSIRKTYSIFLPIERILNNYCKKIIAVSDYDMKNLLKNGIDNVITIYNGIGDPTILNSYQNENLISLLNDIKKKHSYIVMTIARTEYPKRLDLFVRIAKLMQNVNVGFVWIGNNEKIKSESTNIYFLGEINNAGSYISFSDIFVLLSDFEGLPISIIEAMAWGKPIIASKVGGIPELIHNTCGTCVANNADIVIESINNLINNKKLYYLYSKNSRSNFVEKFTSSKMYFKYKVIYEQ